MQFIPWSKSLGHLLQKFVFLLSFVDKIRKKYNILKIEYIYIEILYKKIIYKNGFIIKKLSG